MKTATTSPTVSRLTAEQVPAAAELIARAFDHYEMNRALIPDAAKRRQATAAMAMTRLYRAMSHGYVFVASQGRDVQGVAVWLPPQVKPSSRPPFQVLPATARAAVVYAGAVPRLPLVIARSFRGLARYRRILRTRASTIASAPQWHLAILATDPRHQGRGVGGRLLDHMLERVDADSIGVWLETNHPENVRLYQRFGFIVTAHVEGEDPLPSWWLMQRQRARSSTHPVGTLAATRATQQ